MHGNMKDYALSIKVRNGRIRRKIAECGFKTVNELCRHSGLKHQEVSALLNLKSSPLRQDGAWRSSAVALADVLGCTCEELFSEAQRTLALRDNQGECFVTQDALLKLSARVDRPLLENPEERLLEELDESSKMDLIRQALTTLRARNRKIVEGHFGIGCEERSLADMAVEFNVCWQLAQRLLNETLWQWRTDKSALQRALLQAYQPNNAMSKADEARAHTARMRAAVVRAGRQSNTQARQRRAAQQCARIEGAYRFPTQHDHESRTAA
jgi:hypothetical protein